MITTIVVLTIINLALFIFSIFLNIDTKRKIKFAIEVKREAMAYISLMKEMSNATRRNNNDADANGRADSNDGNGGYKG